MERNCSQASGLFLVTFLALNNFDSHLILYFDVHDTSSRHTGQPALNYRPLPSVSSVRVLRVLLGTGNTCLRIHNGKHIQPLLLAVGERDVTELVNGLQCTWVPLQIMPSKHVAWHAQEARLAGCSCEEL